MTKNMAMFGLALVAMMVASDAAFAAPQCPWWDIFCYFPPPPNNPQPAPAPLLAAGIPAFTALGGGVLVSRLVRRFRRKA
jgi:hypothetical protein